MKVEKTTHVIVTDDKNRKIIFTVPIDFELTDDFIQKKIQNKHKTQAEEWLKRKGFIEEEEGWSFYGDGKKTLKLPGCVRDDDTLDLYVKFHRIEGVKSFNLPSAWSKTFSDNGYSTLNNFPNYINSRYMNFNDDQIDHNHSSCYDEMVSKFYNEIVISRKLLKKDGLKIDDHYLLYLAKNNLHNKIAKLDPNRFNIVALKKFGVDLEDLFKSIKGINKFKL